MPNRMSLSRERKENMKSLLAIITLALALVTPAFAGIEWNFPDGSLSVGASGGAGNAAITLGALGTGWNAVSSPLASPQWAGFGSVPGASGLWDLGQAGSIMLTGVSGSGLTTLNVFQWVNSGTYNGDLTVTRNQTAASLVGSSLAGSLVNGGGWYEYSYNLGAALGALDRITITAGSGGAIIDRLAVVPEPATLIAGAVLLIPFILSTWPILRRRSRLAAAAEATDHKGKS
jgi:hypothetical protein